MNPMLLASLAVALLLGASPSSDGSAESLPVEAVSLLETLRATHAGVDAEGNLWVLSDTETEIVVYSPRGETLWRARIPRSWQADADARWGAVVLNPGGSELRVIAPNGTVRALLPLPRPASGVAWIDGSTVALGMRQAAHRVEIWDVETGAQVRELGDEEPIADRSGAYYVRAMRIDYHAASRRLHTLDSRTGDYAVFELEGRLVARRRVENPRLEALSTWLAEVDREQRTKNESTPMALTYFDLAVDARGTAWTVDCAAEGPSATLTRLGPADDSWGREIPVPCCAKNLVVWSDSFALFGLPVVPEGRICNVTRKLP